MIVALLLLCTSAAATSYLGVAKTSFEFNGSPVFLSGANQAWIQYGADFGNNQTEGEECALQASIRSAQPRHGPLLPCWCPAKRGCRVDRGNERTDTHCDGW